MILSNFRLKNLLEDRTILLNSRKNKFGEKIFRSIYIERSVLRDAIATYRRCGVADLVTQVEA